MPEYLIYFNQQWVGDHTEEWFRGRGPLAMAVVDEIKAAGAYVFAGGLEEDGPVFSADATSGAITEHVNRVRAALAAVLKTAAPTPEATKHVA